MCSVREHWEELGHEVRHDIWWGPERVDEADLCYFYPVQDNLKKASKTDKPPGKRIIAEAVDADIWGGWFRSINWDWVDALVSMSKHMIDFMRPKLPDSLPVHHVPGGVDLDAWTMRRDATRNYNIAWVGRYWIAKNLFGALQIFNALIRCDPGNPWRLFVRAEKWSPNWWRENCLAYLRANPRLAERVTFIEERIPDLNEWLEDKSYIFSTSFKEAFGYSIAEGAAKGLRPVIQQSNGALDIWPREWIFDTHRQAVDMFLGCCTNPEEYRAVIEQRYPLSQRLALLDEICFRG